MLRDIHKSRSECAQFGLALYCNFIILCFCYSVCMCLHVGVCTVMLKDVVILK